MFISLWLIIILLFLYYPEVIRVFSCTVMSIVHTYVLGLEVALLLLAVTQYSL